MTTHPNLAPRLKKEYSYTSTPFLCLHGRLEGELYLYLYKEYGGSNASANLYIPSHRYVFVVRELCQPIVGKRNITASVPPTVLVYECADLATALDESVYSNMLLLFLVV